MRRIVALNVLENYRIWVRFDDGTAGEIDFSGKAHTGVYARWRDYNYFRQARIDSEGQLTWDDQLDFSAESLWRRITSRR
jgi:hypothetical protein